MNSKMGIDMRFFMFLMIVALTMNGCGKQQQEEEKKTETVVSPSSVDTFPSSSESEPPMLAPVVVPQETSPPSPPVASPVVPSVIKSSPKTPPEPVVSAAQPDTSTVTPDALVLAKQSGCLACHSVEKKVVGPAWKEVSARYKSDGEAKAKLIAKVKAGGKGNWIEVTGGIAMPPYSPRVSDQNIETLVDFVLSLAR